MSVALGARRGAVHEPLAGTNPEAVLRLLAERAAGAGPADGARKLALVVEGGGMRGVLSAGSLLALDLLGFRSCFNDVYATSAGGVNAAYFLSGQGALGITVYFDSICNRRFINPLRVGKIVDVDFVYDHIVPRVKVLDEAAVRAAAPRFYLSATDAESGRNVLFDVKARPEPIPLLLKASSALPVLYNRTVLVGGRPYVDGGLSDALPITAAIDRACTDVLVLSSKAPGHEAAAPATWQQGLFYAMMGRRHPSLMRAFADVHRLANRNRRLAAGTERVSGVNVALICPDEDVPLVGRTTTDRGRLVQGAYQLARRTFDAFAGDRAVLDAVFAAYRAGDG